MHLGHGPPGLWARRQRQLSARVRGHGLDTVQRKKGGRNQTVFRNSASLVAAVALSVLSRAASSAASRSIAAS